MKFNKKYISIASFEGFIVLISNTFVLTLLKVFPNPSDFNINVKRYSEYFSKTELAHIFINAIGILVPIILCFIYVLFWKKNHKAQKIINFPIVFSYLSCLGWISSFIFEIPFFFKAKREINISISEVFISLFLLMVLSALFTFTISFFTLKTINRYFYLPRLFPRGHIQEFEKVMFLSLIKINKIYYISVSILPSIYLLSIIYSMYMANSDEKIIKVLILFLIIFVICFFIHLVFTDYFVTPIKKLIEGVEKIKNGDFKTRIKFVSNDDFGTLTDAFNDMTTSLRKKSEKLNVIQNSIIKGMAAMVESRDNSTGEHINRTSDCVKIFVTHLFKENVYPNVSEDFYKAVAKAAPMHDLGKIAVDDSILRKPGKFTEKEYNEMKKHSEEGARIVKFVLKESDDKDFKIIAENVAHYHHEKWNGTGYPEKLSGEAIPFEARIMALADVFDALVSKRCYKESFSFDKAFQIIEESLGSHFDEKLGREFLKCRSILEEFYCVLF